MSVLYWIWEGIQVRSLRLGKNDTLLKKFLSQCYYQIIEKNGIENKLNKAPSTAIYRLQMELRMKGKKMELY